MRVVNSYSATFQGKGPMNFFYNFFPDKLKTSGPLCSHNYQIIDWSKDLQPKAVNPSPSSLPHPSQKRIMYTAVGVL